MLNKLYLPSASKHNICAIVCTLPSRYYSKDIRILNQPDVENLRRGTGGRSSFNGIVATVFGATGFIGRYVCNQLGKRGTQLIIPYRSDSDDYRVKKLKLVGDLGQVIFQPFDAKDATSIRKAVKYSNVVINLIGSEFETKNYSFDDVHVKVAKEIASACREFNIERLIHFSSLNVTENPERYYLKKINFLPSKLKGEHAVLEEYPTATIFRPSCVYGLMDRLLQPLTSRYRATFYSVPLYAAGKKTIKQPVYAPDVASGLWNAICNYETRGKIFQIVGPERFYLRDIVDFCAQILQRQYKTQKFAHDINYDPLFLARMICSNYIFGVFWHYPRNQSNFERIELESVTDVVDKTLPTLKDLGVTLSKLENEVPHIILNRSITQPDYQREFDDYYAAECLSLKAVKNY